MIGPTDGNLDALRRREEEQEEWEAEQEYWREEAERQERALAEEYSRYERRDPSRPQPVLYTKDATYDP